MHHDSMDNGYSSYSDLPPSSPPPDSFDGLSPSDLERADDRDDLNSVSGNDSELFHKSSRIQGLWFDDGRVVLQVGEKFMRLYEGLLAFQSEVLGAMLREDPDEPSANPLLLDINYDRYAFHDPERGEQCLFLKLSDAEDNAEYFFSALYHAGYFDPPPMNTALSIVLGVLKLSRKYKVVSLERKAFLHLSIAYPATLKEWDERTEKSTFLLDRDFHREATSFNESLAVMQTVINLNARWLLPAVTYECCKYDINGLFEHPAWNQDHFLSGELKKRIILGNIAQAEWTLKAISFLTLKPLENCLRRGVCEEQRRDKLNDAMEQGWLRNDPLGVWESEDWRYLLDRMCELCLEVCKGIHQRKREEIWDRLPEIHKMNESWESLMQMKDAYMKQ